MKIALLANLRQSAPSWPEMPPGLWDELDTWETIQAITIALERAGHQVVFLEGDQTLYNNLLAITPDLCFNLCQGYFGEARKAQVPAILEMLRLSYTGAGLLSLVLTSNEVMTKRILSCHGLPTPAFQMLEGLDEPLQANLQFPLLVKSNQTEAINKTTVTSIANDENQLRAQLQRHFEEDYRPVLVEQAITGREIHVSIVGNSAASILKHSPEDKKAPYLSQGLHIFSPSEPKMTFQPVDEDPHQVNHCQGTLPSSYFCPAPLEVDQVAALKRLAAAAFRVMGCLDFGEVIFRLDENDHHKPYIVQVSPLPSLNPSQALYLAAAGDGWRYDELINRILMEAQQRHQLMPQTNYQRQLMGINGYW